jgi:putative transcription factor
MSKKMSSQFEKDCPICGGIIWGRGQNVLIEGAKITVCQSCAQYGVKIKNIPSLSDNIKQSYAMSESPAKKKVYNREIDNGLEIVEDYVTRIKNARNSRGLNQDQFAQKLNEKPSLLRRIEAGKVEPTIKLAKKIEQVYEITLVKKVDEIEPSLPQTKYMKKSSSSSLGDIAFVKKRKE